VLLELGFFRARFDHDTTGLDTLVRHALATSSNDTRILSLGAAWLSTRSQFDSAYALMVRAAALDPRSPNTLATAGYGATARRRWTDALRYAGALITLDSTDERGWFMRGLVFTMQGDTVSAQHDLARAMEVIPHPSVLLLNTMAYAGTASARRYLTLSARELGVATLYDSVWVYFDVKADACAQIGDQVCERAYYDSIRTILENRTLSGGSEASMLSELALAQAAVGRPGESRRTLDRMLSFARGSSTRADQTGNLDATIMGGLYARLGQPDSAVIWLEKTIANPIGRYTSQGLAVNPKLRVLHGTPAFERFLGAHPR
jgi:Flp pilus assembly protein TadD